MSDPLDEDAPLIADVAARAVDLLGDATAGSVGYPGLHSVEDFEAVLAALGRLAVELEGTARHLDDYLADQLDRDQLVRAPASCQPPHVAAEAVGDALLEVRRLTAALSAAVSAAELATLQLRSR